MKTSTVGEYSFLLPSFFFFNFLVKRYGYDKWSKWDVLHLVRFLLQHGAKNSINQAGNSALACVFRHIRDMEVCFELLSMLIKEDGELCDFRI